MNVSFVGESLLPTHTGDRSEILQKKTRKKVKLIELSILSESLVHRGPEASLWKRIAIQISGKTTVELLCITRLSTQFFYE